MSLHAHEHPVMQKVLIGLFVWGMMLFSVRVAYGQPTFPMPSDLTRPPEGFGQVPPLGSFQIPEIPSAPSGMPSSENCKEQCEDAEKVCKSRAGDNADAVATCGTIRGECNNKCAQIPGGPAGIPGGVPGGMPDTSKFEDMMKRGEEAQREGEKKGLEQMKKGAKGMEKTMKMVRGKIDAIKAKGLTPPEVLAQAVADFDANYEALKGADTLDVGQIALDKLTAVMEIIPEELPKLEMAANMNKIFAQVEKEYAKLKKSSDKQRPKLAQYQEQLGDRIAEMDTNIAGIRAAIDEAKTPGKDPAAAIEKLQDDAFGKFEETWQLYGSLEAMRAIKATMKKIEGQIKANDKLINKLTKSGSPLAGQLSEIQAKIKTQYASIKGTVSGTDFDPLFESLMGLADLQQQFEDTVIESQDDGDVTNDKLSSANGYGVPQFAPPSGLPGSGVTDEKSLEYFKKIAPYRPAHKPEMPKNESN